MDDLNSRLCQSDADVLARIMDLEIGPAETWPSGELGALLQNHLSLPLRQVLLDSAPYLVSRLEAIPDLNACLSRSFVSLLFDPQVTVGILVVIKEYAREQWLNPASPVPGDVLEVLYYLSIAVALVRCSRSIACLDANSLRCGFRHLVTLPWLDAPTRTTLTEALTALEAGQIKV